MRASRTAKSACWPRARPASRRRAASSATRAGARPTRGNFVFYLKNATVYLPLNTVWMKFRSGASQIAISSGGGSRTITGTTGDPRLSGLT